MANDAGVASVTDEVTATPVDMPLALAASMSVPHGCSKTVVATLRLSVFCAHDHAVAPAAESVTRLLAEYVCELPVANASKLRGTIGAGWPLMRGRGNNAVFL